MSDRCDANNSERTGGGWAGEQEFLPSKEKGYPAPIGLFEVNIEPAGLRVHRREFGQAESTENAKGGTDEPDGDDERE